MTQVLTPITTIVETRGSNLDYGFDYDDWLEGDTIISSSWELPVSLTLSAESFTSTSTTVWIDTTNGTVGSRYVITNTISTPTRTDSRSFILEIQKR